MRYSYIFPQILDSAPAQIAQYGLAVILNVLTLLAGMVFWQEFGERPPIILFIVPIAVSAWYGGLRSGLLAVLLGGLGYVYYLMEPRYSFLITSSADWVHLTLYVSIGCLLSWLIEKIQTGRHQAEAHALAAERWGHELEIQIGKQERADAERDRLLEELDIERARLKNVIEELGIERARLKTVFENIPAGLLLADAPSGRIVMANQRLKQMVGHPLISPPGTELQRDW